MAKDEQRLNELAQDFFTTMFGAKKQKKLRPLVKQLTYKGVTKKWTTDGNGNFLDYIGKPRISYEFGKNENETIEEFTKRLIEEGVFK